MRAMFLLPMLCLASLAQAADTTARDAAFEQKMSGCVLVGAFSIDGKEKDAPAPERYEIKRVVKQADDFWLFTTRIKYGKVDTEVPLMLKVVWAEDTPIITLTDFTIPGMGTFTSRVMIFGDRYAGTWQHDTVGGHLWGKVETK